MNKKNTESNLATLLAFDYGTKKIGCAVGNLPLQTSSPLMLVSAKDGVPSWDQINEIVEEWRPDGMVIGVPDNMDGSESILSQRAKKFSRQLKERYQLPCFLMDERLTSFEARDHLSSADQVRGRPGKSTKKSQKGPTVDAVAAQLILQSWYEVENKQKV